jgi:hypothetical protein
MARQVPSDLLSFRDAVQGSLGSMSASASEIASKIGSLSGSVAATKNSVLESYQSSTEVNQGAAKLESSNEIMTKIGSDAQSTLTSAVSSAGAICSGVDEMESLLADIENQNAIISRERGKEYPNVGAINSANSKIKEDETKFDELCSKATEQLAALKGMDSSVPGAESGDGGASADGVATGTASLAEYTKYLNQLKYGTFTTKTYTASNGIELKYYLYVPDYGTEVSGLPVFMYMHGAGFDDIGEQIVTYGGLGEAIQNQTVTPSGIVVMPYVKNGRLYEKEEYRDALAELPIAVCKEYNGDTNRISCGGVSYGAVTAYRLVNEHPGEFSAVVGACGAEEITDAFENVKAWNFNGRNEANNHTGRKYVGKQTEAVNAAGGKAMYTTFDNVWAHTKCGTIAFQNKHTDENGNEVYPFEWAFAQTKEEKVKS